tara:strand:- start:237 stop:410 length:174 start_codon:yes stop_codon:yes gene_type:complete
MLKCNKNPFRAISDYSETKADQRHLNKEGLKLYNLYVKKRLILSVHIDQNVLLEKIR